MDSEENKLYYFIPLELLRLKNFWRRAISEVLEITSSANRVVLRAKDPSLVL